MKAWLVAYGLVERCSLFRTMPPGIKDYQNLLNQVLLPLWVCLSKWGIPSLACWQFPLLSQGGHSRAKRLTSWSVFRRSHPLPLIMPVCMNRRKKKSTNEAWSRLNCVPVKKGLEKYFKPVRWRSLLPVLMTGASSKPTKPTGN